MRDQECYAIEDRERAKALATALEAQGWSVWWDRTSRDWSRRRSRRQGVKASLIATRSGWLALIKTHGLRDLMDHIEM
jgi:UDP-N-acetylglucosamine:LPS N-acetylglucosamine transferase